jgi:phage protein U
LKTLSPDKVDYETTYRWADQEPIGFHPISSFLGPDKERLTLSGILYPEFSGRLDHLKQIRDLGATGSAQRLIYADTQLGQNLGMWKIKSIKENRSTFWGDGVPRKIEFTIELESYAQRAA